MELSIGRLKSVDDALTCCSYASVKALSVFISASFLNMEQNGLTKRKVPIAAKSATPIVCHKAMIAFSPD